MFSIPRNLTEAPLPDDMGVWSCDCFPDIITHLWANGEWYPDAFPGDQSPSVNALKAAMGLTFGVEIHHYAKVELAGFVEMIDALGGVTINVPQRIVDDSYPHEDGSFERIVIEAGEQHLDGHLVRRSAEAHRGEGGLARLKRKPRPTVKGLAVAPLIVELAGDRGVRQEQGDHDRTKCRPDDKSMTPAPA